METYVREPVIEESPQTRYEKKKTVFRSNQVIWYLLGAVETILLLRFLLLMFAANPASGFAQLVYSVSAPLVQPFRGLFPEPTAGGSVFEWSTIVAMIVYFLVATGIVRLLQFIKPTSPEEVNRAVSA